MREKKGGKTFLSFNSTNTPRDANTNASFIPCLVLEHRKTRNTRIPFRMKRPHHHHWSSLSSSKLYLKLVFRMIFRMILNQILNKNSKYHFERSDHRIIGRRCDYSANIFFNTNFHELIKNFFSKHKPTITNLCK